MRASRRTQKNPPLWDDPAFVERATRLALQSGQQIGDACEKAGVSRDILNHPANTNGRGIELILQLAKALDTDPVILMGLRQQQPISATALERLVTAANSSAQMYMALCASRHPPEKFDCDAVIDALAGLMEVLGRVARTLTPQD